MRIKQINGLGSIRCITCGKILALRNIIESVQNLKSDEDWLNFFKVNRKTIKRICCKTSLRTNRFPIAHAKKRVKKKRRFLKKKKNSDILKTFLSDIQELKRRAELKTFTINKNIAKIKNKNIHNTQKNKNKNIHDNKKNKKIKK